MVIFLTELKSSNRRVFLFDIIFEIPFQNKKDPFFHNT